MKTTMKTTTKTKQNKYGKWYEEMMLNEIHWFTEQKSSLIGLNYYAEENYDIGEYEDEKDKTSVSEEAAYYIYEMNNCLRTLHELYLHGLETEKLCIHGVRNTSNRHENKNLIIPMTFIENWCNGMYDDHFKDLEVYSNEVKLLKSTDL